MDFKSEMSKQEEELKYMQLTIRPSFIGKERHIQLKWQINDRVYGYDKLIPLHDYFWENFGNFFKLAQHIGSQLLVKEIKEGKIKAVSAETRKLCGIEEVSNGL